MPARRGEMATWSRRGDECSQSPDAAPILSKPSRAPTRASCRSRSTACSTGATSGGKRWLMSHDRPKGHNGHKGSDGNLVKYSVITFGCRVNQADSLNVEEGLRAQGAIASEAEEADIVVGDTCSVTASADQA